MNKLRLAASVVVLAACGSGQTEVPPTPGKGARTPVPTAATGACTLLTAQAADTRPPRDEDGDGSDDADMFGGDTDDGQSHKAEPWVEGNTCEVADNNLARVEAAIRAEKQGSVAKSKAWDHKSTPRYMKHVATRLSLTSEDQKLLAKNGFVVVGKQRFGSYGAAFHEIYQSQLPLYVSVDSVMQAVYAGNEGIIAELEDEQLAPALRTTLDAMACGLAEASKQYTAETARDLDLYLAVARALLDGDAPKSAFADASVEDEAKKLVESAVAASEVTTVTMFGRPRVVDFTAYTPRSHYATTAERQRYFRASMWLSRIELNLVSRSSRSSQPGDTPDPRETPREDVDAVALADLVEKTGAAPAIAKLDTAWALFAGRREDVSVAQITAMHIDPKAPDAAADLRAAIGDRFKRTARLHYMPAGSTELPAILTLLGPRVVPDAAATRPLVNGAIPDRTVLPLADLGFALGHDRALAYEQDELAKYPTLESKLKEARTIVATAPRGTDDMYSAWLDAIVAMSQRPSGELPSFMAGDAFADLRLNSALTSYGQLKHNFVLVVGESYFEGGCEVPDGYVEPAPATYDALIEYAARGERALSSLDPSDGTKGRAYFKRVGEVLRVLRTIQADELAGRALSPDEKQWLSMVAEITPWTTGGPPTYTGWWFDLHRKRRDEGLANPDFIASYFTGEKVGYVGSRGAYLGAFVVDTGGAPRVMVGPVSHAYEVQGGVQKRLTDADAEKLAADDRKSPWSAAYMTAEVAAPPFEITDWDGEVTVTTPKPMTLVIETVDHHRDAIARTTHKLKAGNTVLKIKQQDRVDGLHLSVGAWNGWLDRSMASGAVEGSFGGFKSDESGGDGDENQTE